MAVDKVMVEDVTVSINTGTEATPTWTPIGGLTEPVEHSPSTTRVDLTDCDSAGREEHRVVRRGDSFTLKGFVLEDEASGDRDAGQEACETLAGQTGAASLGQFKVETPGGTALTFKASAQCKTFGGGYNDALPWECELTVSGAIAKA